MPKKLKMSHKGRIKIAIVNFVDCSGDNLWREEGDSLSPSPCTGVGLLLEETPKYVTINLVKENEHSQHTNHFSIPRVCIESLRTMEIDMPHKGTKGNYPSKPGHKKPAKKRGGKKKR